MAPVSISTPTRTIAAAAVRRMRARRVRPASRGRARVARCPRAPISASFRRCVAASRMARAGADTPCSCRATERLSKRPRSRTSAVDAHEREDENEDVGRGCPWGFLANHPLNHS
jgi:hypothetical protein